jgi:hypothetical protein
MAGSGIATGVFKRFSYKKETNLNELPGQTGAKRLRRVTETLNFSRPEIESQEIRSDQQTFDDRLGSHNVQGPINGELSLGTFQEFLASLLRAPWAAGISVTQADMTSVTTTTSTIVAAAGDWIAEGFRLNDVIRATGLADTANNNKNLRIVGITASTLTVAGTSDNAAQNAAPLVANAVADTSFTISVPGKKVMVPRTGHTDESYTFEKFYQLPDGSPGDVEVMTGCKIGSADISTQGDAMVTFNMNVMGLDMTDDPLGTGVIPYFTTPAPETETPVVASTGGRLRIAGQDYITVTALSLQINGNLTGEAVVGSNIKPDNFVGRITVTGEFTAFYKGGNITKKFKNEEDVSVAFMLIAPGTAPAGFINIVLPRVKLLSAEKDDGEGAIKQRVGFRALLPPFTTGVDQSTIILQDSSLV